MTTKDEFGRGLALETQYGLLGSALATFPLKTSNLIYKWESS